MNHLGDAIAKLRHDRGMTQEALAETLCVSPQTISKWENSVNLPDVQMLPLIADVFGVRIDALFGRGDQRAERTAEQVFDDAFEAVKRMIAGLSSMPGESPEAVWERYNAALREDGRARSAICQEQNMVYLREAVGMLALKRPKQGWHSLLQSESAARTVELLSSADFRRALGCVLEHGMRDFTLPFLCKRAGVTDAAALEQSLRDSGLFELKELSVDDQPLTFYSLRIHNAKLLALLAALTYCAEFDEWQGVFYTYYDMGPMH